MKLLWTLLFLLLLSPCESRPPETTSVSPPAQVSPTAPSSDQRRFHRLPGLCRRLKRRRITVMCNLDKFCWPPLSRDQDQDQDQDQEPSGSRPGQVCRCPRGQRCSHYFIHSL